MILKFKASGESFDVRDEGGLSRYTVKLSLNDGFFAEVYDELFVSQLADIKLTDSGYTITAFDTEIGTLTKKDNGYCSISGDITLTDLGERGYAAEVLGEKARLAIRNNVVVMQTEQESQAILLIALGLMLLSESKVLSSKRKEKKTNKKPQSSDANQYIKNVIAKASVITKAGITAIKNRKPAKGKTAKHCILGLVLSAILLVVGIGGIIVNSSIFSRMTVTRGVIYKADNSDAVARFQVKNHIYRFDASDNYDHGEIVIVRYKKDQKGNITSCTLSKPSTPLFVVFTVIGALGAGAFCFLLFSGIPTLPKKESEQQ